MATKFTQQTKPPLSKRLNWKLILLVVGIVALIAAVFATLEFTNTTHFFHKTTVVIPAGTTGSAETKGEGVSSTPSNSSSSASTQPGDNKGSGSTGTTVSGPLIAPTGTFVSNHHPGLNDTVSSNCTTTSGASCQINFTKDGITRSLPAQTTDRGGSTFWDWKPKDLGLSTGSWTIQAVATANGQSQTASDALNLTVTP